MILSELINVYKLNEYEDKKFKFVRLICIKLYN